MNKRLRRREILDFYAVVGVTVLICVVLSSVSSTLSVFPPHFRTRGPSSPILAKIALPAVVVPLDLSLMRTRPLCVSDCGAPSVFSDLHKLIRLLLC